MNKITQIYRSNRGRIIIVGVVCAVIAGLAVFVVRTDVIDHMTSKGSPTGTKLVLGNGKAATYSLEKVTDSAAQAQGLSGRTSLADHTGMLFEYTETSKRCMWMKDMKFNVDIVWFDASNRITSIVPNLSPGTYPQSYCADSKYVVELPAGTTAKEGLRVGQIVKF